MKLRYLQIASSICITCCHLGMSHPALASQTYSKMLTKEYVVTKKNVNGTIVDKDGNPLIGVTIFEKGTDNGCITDFNGQYQLSLSNRDAVIVISYVGYKTQELKGDQLVEKIVLEEDAVALDELVVVGYAVQKKKELTDEKLVESVVEHAQDIEHRSSKNHSAIVVKGLHDLAVRYSKCCSPVPGDEIVGFVTRGRGVSIHRTDCINIINLSDMERARLIDAEWQQDTEGEGKGLYIAEIKIFCHDRKGLLVDITKIFTEREISISGINSKTSKQGIATISVSFSVKGKEELERLVEKVRQIESVIDIERTTG